MNNPQTAIYHTELIEAQAQLMNGQGQFSNQAITDAANELSLLIAHERITGNKQLEDLFTSALSAVRRLYRL